MAYIAYTNLSTAEEEATQSAVTNGQCYHIIFERHYVWLVDNPEKPRVHKVTSLPGIREARSIQNIDEHMRDGTLGACQDCLIPDMPGLLFHGPSVDSETFHSWQRTVVHTRHGAHVNGSWELAETKWMRRTVCAAKEFAEALAAQRVRCEMNRPAAPATQAGMH